MNRQLMARVEQDREDILREATALRPRAELRAADFAEPVVFGFRQTGGLSLFFGADPVYQFNSQGELRRAYAASALFKAVNGRLQRLDRVREHGQVMLVRSDLSEVEQQEFLSRVESDCRRLTELLESGRYEVVGVVPPDSDAIARLRESLAGLCAPLRIAQRPNAS